jgi:hypothetical protein
MKLDTMIEEYDPILDENEESIKDKLINEYRRLDQKCEQILNKIKNRQQRKFELNDASQNQQ